MAKRFRRVAVAAAGVAVATGLAFPAVAAQAATGYTPNPAQWWMSEWNVPQQVWPLTQGAGVTVGVVDSGVQASASDLNGVVLPGGDMLGDSGSGEKDFLSSQDGHGTVVAEMIAGQGIGGGPVGIAPKAKILPVHVYSGSGNDNALAPIENGIRYAVDHGAGVINLSVGGSFQSATYCEPAMQSAVSYALAHNVVVVAGAGDVNLSGSGPVQPASCAGVLAVGGIEENGTLWSDSTRQSYVSVAAPGDHLLIQGMDGRIGSGNGTSYSSPMVAATAALIRSKYPSMPWYQVDQRIIATAIPVNSVPNDGYGYGIMNVAKAVDASQYPVSSSAPNPPYTRYLAWQKSSGGSQSASAPSASSPSATSSSSSGNAAAIIAGVVVLLLLIAGGVALAIRTRRPR